MSTTFDWLRKHIRISGVITVARRWFVTNAFDGNLSILGLILGTRAVGIIDPRVIVGAGLGICLALAISQSTGNILVERAERLRELKDLEDSMLRGLDNTVHSSTATTAPLVAGIIGGAAPAIYTFSTLVPYVIAVLGIVDETTAFYGSIGTILVSIFLLGALLGRISRGNLLIAGFKMMGVGIVAALILLLLGVFSR